MNALTSMARGYFREEDCQLADFAALVSQQTNPEMVPHAARIEKNVPVYDARALARLLGEAASRKTIMAEFASVLMGGPGVLVLANVYDDTSVLDEAADVFDRIIAAEKTSRGSSADHFAKAGANDRIWNALQKLCLAAPEIFARYHATPAIDAVCEAWLGPNYQMTAQVNLIRPGGAAQEPHRDYHLGFQTADVSRSYPFHVHLLSPVLTLQGGIAHVDIPVEAGPTKLLPFSQAYEPGYAAWRREDFKAHFEEHHVQLPLSKGDAIFFNPALFHAGGHNRSENINRLVNLLQISSAFGRAMETIDRRAMCKALYPVLSAMKQSADMSDMEIASVVAASAEGYSFPTNLDTDPPVGGLAPKTQNQLMHEALGSGWSADAFAKALDDLVARQSA